MASLPPLSYHVIRLRKRRRRRPGRAARRGGMTPDAGSQAQQGREVLRRPSKVIHDVSMEIDRGEFAVFVGPSGCGKSTLLRMIAGLEETTAGQIEIEDRDVTERRAGRPRRGDGLPVLRALSAPDASTRTWPSACAWRGGRRPRSTPRSARRRRSCSSTTTCRRSPSQLSGGQRQRVAIGRAIVRQPKVFLFDEPLSNLDAELRVQMRLELARLHKQIGATMIYVTHDQVEAMTLADKIFVLQGGVVRQAGPPLDLYDDPDNRFVAGFIGSPSDELPRRRASSGRPRAASRSSPTAGRRAGRGAPARARPATGTRVTLGMRPEHLESRRRRRAGAAAHGRHGGGPRRGLLPARPHRRRPADRARAPRQPRELRGPPDRASVSRRPGARLRRGRRAGRAAHRKRIQKPREENDGEEHH